MGSWRRAERLIRCEINRFSLRRGRSALHNIGGPPPYGTPNGKTQTVDSAVLSHLGRGYFRPTRQRIASLWPIRNGEHMRAGSLPGRDGAFASSPLPIAPHKAGVVGDLAVTAILAALDMKRRAETALLMLGGCMPLCVWCSWKRRRSSAVAVSGDRPIKAANARTCRT